MLLKKRIYNKTSYLSVNSRQNLSVNYDSGVPGWSLPSKYVYELYKDKIIISKNTTKVVENCPRNIEKEIWFERLCFPNRN